MKELRMALARPPRALHSEIQFEEHPYFGVSSQLLCANPASPENEETDPDYSSWQTAGRGSSVEPSERRRLRVGTSAARRDSRDLEIINRNADRLNAEAEDALEFQAPWNVDEWQRMTRYRCPLRRFPETQISLQLLEELARRA
jgi:hypothetical protein